MHSNVNKGSEFNEKLTIYGVKFGWYSTRSAWMALNEGLSYALDPVLRAPYAQKSKVFVGRITDALSKKMVRKVKNRWRDEI